MTRQRDVALAWLLLTHSKRRLAAALAGVSFSVLLMFVELGFYFSLFDSMVQLLRYLDADLVLLSRARTSMPVKVGFPRRRLEQVRGVAGVAAVHAVYEEAGAARSARWRNPEDGSRRPIRVLAFDPAEPVVSDPRISQFASRLHPFETVLLDERSKPFLGPTTPGLQTELARRSVEVVGTFSLGTDFLNDGNVIMSPTNFGEFFARSPVHSRLDDVDIGIIRLERRAQAAQVLERIREALPEDVVVLSKEDLIRKEQRFWADSTPIGYVFTLGLVMGFVVGVIICYQILFSDISDHLAEFATLKAVGYGKGQLVGVVFQEAVILSVMGFLLALGLAGGFYELLERWTGLPMSLTVGRSALIFLLTVAMCVISGGLAVRRVLVADPAELF